MYNACKHPYPLIHIHRHIYSKIHTYARLQHDVLPGMMTVREHLLFHARLRLGDATPLHKKQERVRDVLVELKLEVRHA